MLGFTIKAKNNNRVISVPIGKIKPNPNQPRRQFEHEALMGLAESIRHNGILQPLSVRPLEDGNFELVAGERRLRASLMAGFTQVPCIEVSLNDKQSAVMCLIENLQRQDLNFFEEADGIAKLIDTCGLTQEEIAHRLGKKQSTIANKLRLLRLTNGERKMILDHEMTERHARALLRLDDGVRESALRIIISKKLNVQETDKLIEQMLLPNQDKKTQRKMPVIKDVRLFINTVSNAISVMKRAGIDAVAVSRDFDDYLEYTIRIPKAARKSA
ncbi:MAG TPA: ParB/RepB/Spo0J family partition protein [Clostridia bacterium]|nr:ParB/RepB/Spo0J family partition protein [Clostridia bacterium]